MQPTPEPQSWLPLALDIGSFLVLLATGIIVGWYTLETHKLRKLVQQQFNLSQNQFKYQLSLASSNLDPILTLDESQVSHIADNNEQGWQLAILNSGGAIFNVQLTFEGGEADLGALEEGDAWLSGQTIYLRLFQTDGSAGYSGKTFKLNYRRADGVVNEATFLLRGDGHIPKIENKQFLTWTHA